MEQYDAVHMSSTAIEMNSEQCLVSFVRLLEVMNQCPNDGSVITKIEDANMILSTLWLMWKWGMIFILAKYQVLIYWCFRGGLQQLLKALTPIWQILKLNRLDKSNGELEPRWEKDPESCSTEEKKASAVGDEVHENKCNCYYTATHYHLMGKYPRRLCLAALCRSGNSFFYRSGNSFFRG